MAQAHKDYQHEGNGADNARLHRQLEKKIVCAAVNGQPECRHLLGKALLSARAFLIARVPFL